MIIQIKFQYTGLKISIALAAMLISVMDEMSAILNQSSENDFKQPHAWKPIWCRFRYRTGEWAKKREPRCIIETIHSYLENALHVQKNPPWHQSALIYWHFTTFPESISKRTNLIWRKALYVCSKIGPIGLRRKLLQFGVNSSLEGDICSAWSLPPLMWLLVTLSGSWWLLVALGDSWWLLVTLKPIQFSDSVSSWLSHSLGKQWCCHTDSDHASSSKSLFGTISKKSLWPKGHPVVSVLSRGN